VKNGRRDALASRDGDIWFHWSPTSRRKSITRKGLIPGSYSTDRLWKPPHICLAESPRVAWSLSGAMHRGAEHESWDLWEVWTHDLKGYEVLMYDSGTHIKEIRVFERVYKRDVWLVASRMRAG